MELLVSGASGVAFEAFRLVAMLLAGFTVLLGTALLACGMALVIAQTLQGLRSGPDAPRAAAANRRRHA